MVGTSYSSDIGNGDIWLLKSNINGQQIWSRLIGGDQADFGMSLVQTADKG